MMCVDCCIDLEKAGVQRKPSVNRGYQLSLLNASGIIAVENKMDTGTNAMFDTKFCSVLCR